VKTRGLAGKRHHRGWEFGIEMKTTSDQFVKSHFVESFANAKQDLRRERDAERDVSLWRNYRSSALDAAK